MLAGAVSGWWGGPKASTSCRCVKGGDLHAARRRDPNAVAEETRAIRTKGFGEPFRNAGPRGDPGPCAAARDARHPLDARRGDGPCTGRGTRVITVAIERGSEADEPEKANVKQQQRDKQLDEREAAPDPWTVDRGR